MWQARRTAWSQYPPDEGTGSGLYKSTDEGLTWKEVVGNGLPPKPYGRIGIAVASGSHSEVVYALVQTLAKPTKPADRAVTEGSGLYKSDDGGQSWRLVGTDPRIKSRMWYFGQVFVDPQDSKIVYCPNVALMRSTDGGNMFAAIKGAPGGDDYHFIWIDPDNDKRMILSSDQGTVVSVDGGQSWSSWYNQPTGQFYHVSTDDQFPYRIYGAQQDAGTISITSRSDYGTITFRDWYTVGSGESGYIVPDPVNPDIIYGGGTYGDVFRFDRRTGQSQVISPSPISEFGESISARTFRFTWTSPLIVDNHDHKTIYFGAQKILKTSDGGLSWEAISPDLTGRDKTIDKSDSLHAGSGVVYTIAPSPVKAGIIWAGTDDGNIQLTEDGGRHWKNVTPSNLPPWSKVSIIEASEFGAGSAFAAIDRHRLDDIHPYIYRTTDFGAHWIRADHGIAVGSYVQVVRCDPKRRGLLYAGTETGVYISFDYGDNWQSLQLNLPIVSVRDLIVHDDDLIAATHGRAFWILDDLTPLRNLSEDVLKSDVYLFKPARAIRIRRSENTDTPLSPEEPQGMNPPAGAIVDYFLKSSPRTPVKLEILDAQGNLVREYSSKVERRQPEEYQPVADYWFTDEESLGTAAGHNRFVWDLSYPAPPAPEREFGMSVANLKSIEEPEGPLVLPGTYEIRLICEGHAYSQPVEVAMDPRVKVNVSELKDQLTLAIDVWNTMSDESTMADAMKSVKIQLDSIRSGEQFSPLLRAAVDSLLKTIISLTDSVADPGLAQLEGEIMSADRQPTSQMFEAYKAKKIKSSAYSESWENIVLSRLPKLNEELKRAGANQIETSIRTAFHLTMPAAR